MHKPINGKVTYFYLTVPEMKTARTFYRDTLGLEEAWREGESTCAFKLPGTEVQLMLNLKDSSDTNGAGLVFTVPDTDAYYQEQQGSVRFYHAPIDIPGDGRWVGAEDGNGNSFYVANIQ